MDGKPRIKESERRNDGQTDTESNREAPASRSRRGLLKAAGAVLCVGASGHIGRTREGQVRTFRQVSEGEGPPRSSDHSLLFWNSWLLDGILGISAKPQYEERAEEIGRAPDSSGYDIVALCEGFDAASK